MRSGHIIYKVNHLQAAVEEWRAKGFVAEYGKFLKHLVDDNALKIIANETNRDIVQIEYEKE